jgi:hypothetical protein
MDVDGVQGLLRTLIQRVDDVKVAVDVLTHKVFEARETVRTNTETVQGLCERMIKVEAVVDVVADAVERGDDGELVAALSRFSDTMEASHRDAP